MWGRQRGSAARNRGADGGRRSSVAAAVTTFALTSLAAVTVIGVVEAVLLTRSVQTQAIDNARNETKVIAHGVVEPTLTDGAVRGIPCRWPSSTERSRIGF